MVLILEIIINFISVKTNHSFNDSRNILFFVLKPHPDF